MAKSASIELRAITPTKPVGRAPNPVEMAHRLRDYAISVSNRMQDYPPLQSWKGSYPKSGVRKGGKRTGKLGRTWSIEKNTPAHTILSNATFYAGHVEGYKGRGDGGTHQTAFMAARGWPSITTVSREEWVKHLPRVRSAFRQR